MKKFYDKIYQDESGCWIWLGARNAKYGFISIDGKNHLAHRFSYELHCDEIPAGKVVRHSCDNGFCVNPAHLNLGSQQDNMDDKVAKDRQAKGSTIGNSKLTEEDVIEIRRLLNAGSLYQNEIAFKFNVDPKLITQIKYRRIWRHI